MTRLIGTWKPDFVLTLGDNSYPLGIATLLDQNIFRPFAKVFRASAFFPAFGNHDVYLFGGRPELDAFHSLGNERWYRFVWGDGVVRGARLDHLGGMRGRHSSRSPGAPSRRATCFRFAACHHPPSEPPRDRTRRPSPYDGALVEKHRVQVVFQGHLHGYARSRPRNGVTYVTVGTGGAEEIRRRRLDDPDRRRHPGPLRRAARGCRRRRGALSLPHRRREGTRRVPPELLLTTPTDSSRLPVDHSS